MDSRTHSFFQVKEWGKALWLGGISELLDVVVEGGRLDESLCDFEGEIKSRTEFFKGLPCGNPFGKILVAKFEAFEHGEIVSPHLAFCNGALYIQFPVEICGGVAALPLELVRVHSFPPLTKFNLPVLDCDVEGIVGGQALARTPDGGEEFNEWLVVRALISFFFIVGCDGALCPITSRHHFVEGGVQLAEQIVQPIERCHDVS